jgi:UDP-2,3-diacylglucosamine hydrolase
MQRLPSSSKILFLSDVHLSSEESCKSFAGYLNQIQGGYSHLYILGDLFDYWLGQKSERYFQEFQPVLQGLKKLNLEGMQVWFLQGNRDFLLDSSSCQRYGVQLCRDFHTIKLPTCTILLTHGDLLCTSDHKYQLYRRLIRSECLQLFARHLPLKITQKMALRLKKTSKRSIAQKSMRQITVNFQYIRELLKENDVVICGHIHQEMDYALIGQSEKKFLVLGGWEEERGSALEYSCGVFRVLQPQWRTSGDSHSL